MKRANQQFLASSRFTSYKHSAVRGRNLAENLEDFGEAGALADNAAGIQLHVCILRVHILSCVNTLTRIGLPVKMRLLYRIYPQPCRI